MVAIKIIPVNFLYVIYLQKELDKTSFGLYIIALQMYREISNKYRKKGIYSPKTHCSKKYCCFRTFTGKKQLCAKIYPIRLQNGREKRVITNR